mgnify:CR=1 FL=1
MGTLEGEKTGVARGRCYHRPFEEYGVNCPIREDLGDGIRVGSALVRLVEQDGADAVEAVRGLMAQLRDEWQVPQ